MYFSMLRKRDPTGALSVRLTLTRWCSTPPGEVASGLSGAVAFPLIAYQGLMQSAHTALPDPLTATVQEATQEYKGSAVTRSEAAEENKAQAHATPTDEIHEPAGSEQQSQKQSLQPHQDEPVPSKTRKLKVSTNSCKSAKLINLQRPKRATSPLAGLSCSPQRVFRQNKLPKRRALACCICHLDRPIRQLFKSIGMNWNLGTSLPNRPLTLRKATKRTKRTKMTTTGKRKGSRKKRRSRSRRERSVSPACGNTNHAGRI